MKSCSELAGKLAGTTSTSEVLATVTIGVKSLSGAYVKPLMTRCAITCVGVLVKRSVVPSASAAITALSPIAVPPPARFSITTGWPSRADSGVAISRAITSVRELAVEGSTALMGRAGNGCARLSVPGPTPRPVAAVPMRKLRRAIIKRCASGSVRRGDADLMVALLAIFRQRRQAPDGRFGAMPRLRPLRLVAVPGPRIEIAELLILHLVEFDIELDRVVVRVAVIGRDVVAGAMPHRAPEQLDLLGGEHLAGVLHVRDVLELERNVMQLRARALDEIDGVVIGIAAQEHEPVLDPVGDPETQSLRVEVRHDLHVVNREGDMAELERSYAVHLMMRAEIAPLLEQVDRRPVVVLESQHRSHAGHRIVAQLALDAIARHRLPQLPQLPLRP